MIDCLKSSENEDKSRNIRLESFLVILEFLDYRDQINSDNNNPKIAKISERIHIEGNSGWVDFSNAGNCTGQGIYSDPYVIEDLVIDAEGPASGIKIEYSDVFFIIESPIPLKF